MINFRFDLSERLFSAVMSLTAELILANRNLLFQFTTLSFWNMYIEKILMKNIKK